MRGTGDWHLLMVRRTRCVLAWLCYEVWLGIGWWLGCTPACSEHPCERAQSWEVLHTAPTNHHKPLKLLWFPPWVLFCWRRKPWKLRAWWKRGSALGCPDLLLGFSVPHLFKRLLRASSYFPCTPAERTGLPLTFLWAAAERKMHIPRLSPQTQKIHPNLPEWRWLIRRSR